MNWIRLRVHKYSSFWTLNKIAAMHQNQFSSAIIQEIWLSNERKFKKFDSKNLNFGDSCQKKLIEILLQKNNLVFIDCFLF